MNSTQVTDGRRLGLREDGGEERVQRRDAPEDGCEVHRQVAGVIDAFGVCPLGDQELRGADSSRSHRHV